MDDFVAGEAQFINTRKLPLLNSEVAARISSTYHNCRNAKPTELFMDFGCFCKSGNFDEIASHDYVLTPGRYVGAADIKDDGEPIDEKLTRLRTQLLAEFDEADRIEKVIRNRLRAVIR